MLRETGDGRPAGAVEGRQKRPLAHHRQPCVLMVQRRQQVCRRAVSISARYSNGALRTAKACLDPAAASTHSTFIMYAATAQLWWPGDMLLSLKKKEWTWAAAEHTAQSMKRQDRPST